MDHKVTFAAFRDLVTPDQPVVRLFGGEVLDEPIPDRDTGWGVQGQSSMWATLDGDLSVLMVEERPLMTEGEATQVWQRIEMMVDPEILHHCYRLVNVHD